MKETFKPGTLVKFNISNGAVVRLGEYIKEGFYAVWKEGVELVAHEDDLILYEGGNCETANDTEKAIGESNSGHDEAERLC